MNYLNWLRTSISRLIKHFYKITIWCYEAVCTIYVFIGMIMFVALCALSAIAAILWPLIFFNDISFAIGK